jgi:hypothetical protein
MDEYQLIDGLKWCLEHAKLSGAERELCERLVYDGPSALDVDGRGGDVEERRINVRRAREVLLWHGWRG